MQFRRSEHIVTAFLSVSGAAEACFLPFLSLHLTQLGVSPFQAGLCVSAFLLLRSIAGVVWWRTLRQGRKTGRRRLAVVCGVLVSVAVMIGLAAIPPSVGCEESVQSLMPGPPTSLHLPHQAPGQRETHEQLLTQDNADTRMTKPPSSSVSPNGDAIAHHGVPANEGDSWQGSAHEAGNRQRPGSDESSQHDEDSPANSEQVSATTEDERSEHAKDEMKKPTKTTETPSDEHELVAVGEAQKPTTINDNDTPTNSDQNLTASQHHHLPISSGTDDDIGRPGLNASDINHASISSGLQAGESLYPPYEKPDNGHKSDGSTHLQDMGHRTTKPPDFGTTHPMKVEGMDGIGKPHVYFPEDTVVHHSDLNAEITELSHTSRPPKPPFLEETDTDNGVESPIEDQGASIESGGSDEKDTEPLLHHHALGDSSISAPIEPPNISGIDEMQHEISSSEDEETGPDRSQTGLPHKPQHHHHHHKQQQQDDKDAPISHHMNPAMFDVEGNIVAAPQGSDAETHKTDAIDSGEGENWPQQPEPETISTERPIVKHPAHPPGIKDTPLGVHGSDDVPEVHHSKLPVPDNASPEKADQSPDTKPIVADPSGISSNRNVYQTSLPRSCIEFSQLEIPFDPLKYPDGVEICDPAHPENTHVEYRDYPHGHSLPGSNRRGTLRDNPMRHDDVHREIVSSRMRFANKTVLDNGRSASQLGRREEVNRVAFSVDRESNPATHSPLDALRGAVLKPQDTLPVISPRQHLSSGSEYRQKATNPDANRISSLAHHYHAGRDPSNSESEINTIAALNRMPDHLRRRNYHRGRPNKSGAYHPVGGLGQHKLRLRPGVGGVMVTTAPPPSLWSLSEAIKKLKKMSPTLTRLLGGEEAHKKRRRTIQRRSNRRKRPSVTKARRHHRAKRYKRSLILSSVEDPDFNRLASHGDNQFPTEADEYESKTRLVAQGQHSMLLSKHSDTHGNVPGYSDQNRATGSNQPSLTPSRKRRRTIYAKILPEWPPADVAPPSDYHHPPSPKREGLYATQGGGGEGEKPASRVVGLAEESRISQSTAHVVHADMGPVDKMRATLVRQALVNSRVSHVRTGVSLGSVSQRNHHLGGTVLRSGERRIEVRNQIYQPDQERSNANTRPQKVTRQEELSINSISSRVHTSPTVNDRKIESGNQSAHLHRSERYLPIRGVKGRYTRVEVHGSITYRFTSSASPLDPYLLFLLTMGLLSLYGFLGAPYRHLVSQSWRLSLDEAEHLERSGRHLSTADATSASVLAASAALAAFLPDCVSQRRPLAVVLVIGATLSLANLLIVPWLPLIGGKAPPPRLRIAIRTLVASRSSLLFTSAVFSVGAMSSAEFNFLLPYSAARWPQPTFVFLLTVALALVSRLPVRAVHRPLMTRIGFVGTVVLSFSALTTRCLCYLCLPSQWGLLPAQLLSGLTETMFWLALVVFVDKTAHLGHERTTMWLLDGVYTAGRCAGAAFTGLSFSLMGPTATFALLATASAGAALGYYIVARYSADAPDLAYAKLPSDDVTSPMTSWAHDSADDDVENITTNADQDWLERAMRKEGLL